MTIHSTRRVSPEEDARHILEECRAMAVGVQALTGFLLLSILTPALYDRLGESLRFLHLSGLVLVIVSMFLLLTPAAIHRLGEPGLATERFLDSASQLIGWALAALRLGLVVEVYTAARALGASASAATGLAGFLFMLSWTLWSVYPRVSAMRLAPHAGSD